MTFIDASVGRQVDGGLVWGVESMCAVLSEHGCAIAPSTYYEARDRRAAVDPCAA